MGRKTKDKRKTHKQTEGQAGMEGNRNVGRADRHIVSSESHLHLALDLEAEGFIPLWVRTVGDGPSPQPLMRSGGQPEAHKAVCLAHCPRKTRVGGKVGSQPGSREESGGSEGNFRQVTSRASPCLSFRPLSPLLTHGSDSPKAFVPEPLRRP